jgi:hypothetical protein
MRLNMGNGMTVRVKVCVCVYVCVCVKYVYAEDMYVIKINRIGAFLHKELEE